MKKDEKTQLTISKILEAAMNEFGINGYSGGTINNICSTGINKGLLYHNFDGKDDIYLTCLKYSCEKLMNYLKGRNCTENPAQYMSARMEFFNNHSKETHIFFEAFLSPPSHLSDKIRLILSEFNSFNESMFPCLWNCFLLYQYTCLSGVCLWRYCPCNRTCTCFVHCQ